MRLPRSGIGLAALLKSRARRLERLLLALPVVFCVYFLIADENGLYQIRHRDGQIQMEKQAIDSLYAHNERLATALALLKTEGSAIERIARERYGMVRENERVYMVYPSPPAAEVPRTGK